LIDIYERSQITSCTLPQSPENLHREICGVIQVKINIAVECYWDRTKCRNILVCRVIHNPCHNSVCTVAVLTNAHKYVEIRL
jgi:hypothetical protein